MDEGDGRGGWKGGVAGARERKGREEKDRKGERQGERRSPLIISQFMHC